ncbi:MULTISPECIES: hypothetical protein [unclassified Mycobacterium]|uniref:hypothetical protein n=1 Tax=unclassified Mycobacterium TaxID=2642494 RepID=UPI00074029E9|nr:MULTISPECIES: hypothetical protein [unclassified Mycobacterium]KUH82304.1 hypothetical protein AU185_21745 [Mycobacterium sp. GA-0227b]KUH90162.1 hypothetical protein AU186_10885 [Mycobacterium sp. GA-1999]KUH95042.1 hypothetical protein AU187_15700 [Mycobacterium sp. IS-1556]
MTSDATSADALASADAVVAAVEPGLAPPEVRVRDVVLVTGPWLAGTTSVAAALREQIPEHTFVEADELGRTDAPIAVVFVVSAVSPLTESDCELMDLVTPHTDLVVGVVAKIDTHRNWRDVLAANRAVLAGWSPRHAHVPWVGTAAAPDLGEPRVDELVGLLRQRLADPELKRRNRLRAWETRLGTAIERCRSDGDGADRRARVKALQQAREDIARSRRQAKSEHAIALRSQLQQARVQLGYFARKRCTSVRAELAEDAAQLSRRRLGGFESHVRERVGEVVAEVEEGISAQLTDVAAQLGLTAPPTPAAPSAPEVTAPPLKSRRLETQLTMILGAGFGLGVALAVTRLFTGLAPGLTIAGLVAGGLVGLALTVWVVGIRGLLHDRAVLDRWVTDIASIVKSALEERVATRMLAAESALTSESAARDEREAAAAEVQVAEIDAELREHAVQTARAAAVRDKRLPSLHRALDAVRAELYGKRPSESFL